MENNAVENRDNYLKEYAKYTSLNVAGMLGISCYILADTFFVSKGLGAEGLAALNIALPIFNFIRGIGLMMGIGGATKYSILKGQRENQKANKVFSIMAITVVLISVLIVLAGVFFSENITYALGADENVFDMTNSYLRVICIFAPFFMMNDTLICFVRNDRNPNLPMVAMVLGSLANILLDYIFIFPLGMGIFGAALATGMAPAIGMVIISLHWIKFDNELRLIKVRIETSAIKNAVSLGFPSFVTEVSSGIVILVFNMIILKLQGNTGVAAYGVIANISLVVISIYTGIAQGIQPIMSRAFGKEDMDNVKRVFKYAAITVAAVSVLIYLNVFVFSEGITQIFNSENNAELQKIAVRGLKIYFTAILFAGFNISLAMLFTSTQRAFPAHVISVMRGLVIIVPMVFLLSGIFGLDGVWMSFPITEITVSFIGTAVYCVFKRKDVY